MVKQDSIQALPAHRTPWAWLVGTFFGIGLLRPGPGTYGSVAAVLLWFGVAHAIQALHLPALFLAFLTAAAAIAAVWIGVPAATIVARESDSKDPGHIVIDEVAGQLIALIAIPAEWKHAALSLLLFRAFDIIKPPPIRQLERLPEGQGIVFDDVAAGILALAFGHAALLFF